MWASKICSGLQQKTACIAKNTVPDLFQILVEDLSPDKNKSPRFHTRDFFYIFILEIFSLTKKNTFTVTLFNTSTSVFRRNVIIFIFWQEKQRMVKSKIFVKLWVKIATTKGTNITRSLLNPGLVTLENVRDSIYCQNRAKVRVGHRVLFRSERIVLLHSFKERNVL